MTTMITFNELRKIKDQLPSGSMQKIADELVWLSVIIWIS